MKTKTVKDLMVPLSEYATVKTGATLYNVVISLKKAQEEFDKTRYRHRAVLVLDDNNNIVGKVTQFDILRALEPKYDEMLSGTKKSFNLGFTRSFQKSMLEQLRLWDGPMEHICKKAMEKKVETFMYAPEDVEIIEADSTLSEAIHQLVIGSHQSLLVIDNKKVIGVLRLTDVFEAIAESVLSCELK